MRPTETALYVLNKVCWDMHSIQKCFCNLIMKNNHAYKDVLGLHVAMDYPIVMKVMKGSDQLFCNVANDWLRKAFVVLKDLKELSWMEFMLKVALI